MGWLYRPLLKSGRRSKVWWAKWHVNGRPVRESTKISADTKTPPAQARRFLQDREGRVAQGAPIPPRLDRILYDELAHDLRTFYETTGTRGLAEVDDRLAYLNAFFQSRRAVSIGPALITQYVAARQEHRRRGRPPANRTINIELAMLKRMLRLAYKNEKLLRVPPIDMLKEAPAREGFFEAHQYEAVRRRLPDDLRVALAIAHTFGWRKAEVLSLERRQLDLKAGTLRLDPGTTKNGEGRTVYLTPDLKGALAAQLDRVDALQKTLGRIVPFLFPHLSGRRAGQRRQGFARRWRTACADAGVPGRLLHDFRRTAVRNLERAGVARSVAMKITGHKTESVYRRYAIVSDADLQEATRKLIGTFWARSSPSPLDTPSLSTQNP
jgi:integrase